MLGVEINLSPVEINSFRVEFNLYLFLSLFAQRKARGLGNRVLFLCELLANGLQFLLTDDELLATLYEFPANLSEFPSTPLAAMKEMGHLALFLPESLKVYIIVGGLV